MQKIAREFNFGETAFVLPKNDSNTYRVRIVTARTSSTSRGIPR
jgi:predicted PhzF superfamily epimerase YddE/YHI9